MQITLNGQTVETQQTTLEQLLVEQGYADCNVATAFNDQFIPKAQRETVSLKAQCVVEIVAPMQGG